MSSWITWLIKCQVSFTLINSFFKGKTQACGPSVPQVGSAFHLLTRNSTATALDRKFGVTDAEPEDVGKAKGEGVHS